MVIEISDTCMFLKLANKILEGSRTNLFEGQGRCPNICCKGENFECQTGKEISYKICQSTQVPVDGIGSLSSYKSKVSKRFNNP